MLKEMRDRYRGYKQEREDNKNKTDSALEQEKLVEDNQKSRSGYMLKPTGESGEVPEKVGTLEFYTELLFSSLAQGNIDKPPENAIIPRGYFYYSTNKIFTANSVKKIYFIDEFPVFIDKDFISGLRRSVGNYAHLNVIRRIEPYKYDRNSWGAQMRMKAWRQRALEYEKKLGEQSSGVEEIFMGLDEQASRNNTEHMISSWAWVNDTETNKDEFCKFSLTLELVAKNLSYLYRAEDLLLDALEMYRLGHKSIFVQTNEYYKSFAPTNANRGGALVDLHPPGVMSDRVVSNLFDNSHGRAGDDHGLYFGNDIFTNEALTYDLTKGSDAVNFLLTAKTGEGKSAASKVLMTHIALEGFHSIDVDYEGDEYTAIGRVHGAKIINMSSDNAIYYDTTEIGDLTGDPEIDSTLKEDAISTTKLVFDVLVSNNENPGMTFAEVSLFNDMITRVYDKRGVTDDPETWKNSKGATYEELYRELLKMEHDPMYAEDRETIRDMIKKLRIFFDGNMYSNMFKNKVSINDLLGHPNIVFSFGMKGKTETSIDPKLLALRQLFVGYIIMLLCNYNKTALKKSTAVKLEELQRYMNHEASSKMVNDIVTGGRKRNMIVFLITNSPMQFLSHVNGEVNTGASPYAESIKNNITGFIIGKQNKGVVDALVDGFQDLAECRDDLMEINLNEYKYCFLVRYRGETSLVKFQIPPVLLENTQVYSTREDHGG